MFMCNLEWSIALSTPGMKSTLFSVYMTNAHAEMHVVQLDFSGIDQLAAGISA